MDSEEWDPDTCRPKQYKEDEGFHYQGNFCSFNEYPPEIWAQYLHDGKKGHLFFLNFAILVTSYDPWRQKYSSKQRKLQKVEIGPPFSLYEKKLAKHSWPSKKWNPPSEDAVDPDLFEGDILQPHSLNRRAGSVLSILRKPSLWPNGIVPYIVESSFDFEERLVIAEAIEEIESASCVRFVPLRKQKDFVYINKGHNCASGVGREGGIQPLVLGKKCLHFGVILHELLHLLGFWHEHSRLDRNKYVNIHWENILPGSYSNFEKNPHFKSSRLKLPYDYNSILHYAPYTFSKDPNKPSITPKKIGVRIGQRKRLSKMNIEGINQLYKCQGRSFRERDDHIDNIDEAACLDSHWSCAAGRLLGLCLWKSKQMSKTCRKSCNYC